MDLLTNSSKLKPQEKDEPLAQEGSRTFSEALKRIKESPLRSLLLDKNKN
jgi:hypothetical protein